MHIGQLARCGGNEEANLCGNFCFYHTYQISDFTCISIHTILSNRWMLIECYQMTGFFIFVNVKILIFDNGNCSPSLATNNTFQYLTSSDYALVVRKWWRHGRGQNDNYNIFFFLMLSCQLEPKREWCTHDMKNQLWKLVPAIMVSNPQDIKLVGRPPSSTQVPRRAKRLWMMHFYW